MTTIRCGSFVGLLVALVLLSDTRTMKAAPPKDGCDTECHTRNYFTDGNPGDCWSYDPEDCNWCKNLGRCTTDPPLELPDCIKVKGQDGKYLQTTRNHYALGACSPLCIAQPAMYAEASQPTGTPDLTVTIDLYTCDMAP
jgi:hypothetical protein